MDDATSYASTDYVAGLRLATVAVHDLSPDARAELEMELASLAERGLLARRGGIAEAFPAVRAAFDRVHEIVSARTRANADGMRS
jgi:hypothetical protein